MKPLIFLIAAAILLSGRSASAEASADSTRFQRFFVVPLGAFSEAF